MKKHVFMLFICKSMFLTFMVTISCRKSVLDREPVSGEIRWPRLHEWVSSRWSSLKTSWFTRSSLVPRPAAVMLSTGDTAEKRPFSSDARAHKILGMGSLELSLTSGTAWRPEKIVALASKTTSFFLENASFESISANIKTSTVSFYRLWSSS